jgi:hypothetical protein
VGFGIDRDEGLARAEQHLSASAGDVLERLRAWIDERAAEETKDAEIRRLRNRAIASDAQLRALRVEHYNRVHTAIARAVAADTGQSPDAAGPQMIAPRPSRCSACWHGSPRRNSQTKGSPSSTAASASCAAPSTR